MNKSKIKVIIAAVILLAVCITSLCIIRSQHTRPTLDEYEGTFRMSDGRVIKLAADPTDDYDMKGYIYSESDASTRRGILAYYTPAGALVIEAVDAEEMIGMMNVTSGRYEYIDVETEEKLTMERTEAAPSQEEEEELG